MKFTGIIRSMQEGEVVFNNEPLLRVDAPLGEAQIIETALLNIVNYQTLIATKRTYETSFASNDELLEFGTRRAHEFDLCPLGDASLRLYWWFLLYKQRSCWETLWDSCSWHTRSLFRSSISR